MAEITEKTGESLYAGDRALRRAAFGRYAVASVCLEQGGDLLPRALCRGREALALLERLSLPGPEDRALAEELRGLLARAEAAAGTE